MKKVWLLSLVLVVVFAGNLSAQVFTPGLQPLAPPPPPSPPVEQSATSFKFDADDVLATEDNFNFYVGKIEGTEGKGTSKVLHVVFADGHEAWIKPERVIDKFHPVTKDELKVGQKVLYTTQQPETFQNGSIRFTSFSKGKIRGISDIEQKYVTVNADEVRWDQQVVVW